MRHRIVFISIAVIIFLILFIPTFSSRIIENQNKDLAIENPSFLARLDEIEEATVTCFASSLENPYSEIQQNLSAEQIKILFTKLTELNHLTAQQSANETIDQLKEEIIDLAKEYKLLPQNYKLPETTSFPQLDLSHLPKFPTKPLGTTDYRRSQFMVNFISVGSGFSGPFIIFPRLVPILLFPIPRLLFFWSAEEAFTACGGMIRLLGFWATGAQAGIALGFWGVGFSIFLPPEMAYGVFGYTAFISVKAEEFVGFPGVMFYYILLLLLSGYY